MTQLLNFIPFFLKGEIVRINNSLWNRDEENQRAATDRIRNMNLLSSEDCIHQFHGICVYRCRNFNFCYIWFSWSKGNMDTWGENSEAHLYTWVVSLFTLKTIVSVEWANKIPIEWDHGLKLKILFTSTR